MMLNQVQLMFNLKMREIPTEETVAASRELIKRYAYPVGIINTEVLREGKVYQNYSIDQNYTFLKQFITTVFSIYYNESEINIITIYLLNFVYNNTEMNDKLLKFVNPILFNHSEKEDVEYCLDSLRYARLIAMLYLEDVDESLLRRLFAELKDIEEQHNIFGAALIHML